MGWKDFKKKVEGNGLVRGLRGIRNGVDSLDEKVSDVFRGSVKKGIDIVVKRPLYALGRKAFVAELEKQFGEREKGYVFLKVDGSSGDQRDCIGSFGESVGKHYGNARSFAFKHIPYVALEVSHHDLENICSDIKGKGVPYLSGSLRGMFKGVSKGGLKYAPEKVLEFAREEKIRLPGVVQRVSSLGLDYQWNLDHIGVEGAHSISRGEGSVVAIVDTGVDYTHSELSGNFGSLKGVNVVAGNNDPMDDEGHGTHVAGTVAGSTVGVAPNSTLYAVKVLDRNGSGTLFDVVSGIEWAIDNNVDVINMSLGSSQYTEMEQMICSAAYDAGIVVVAAAGNEYVGPSYPAHCKHVISVAAVDFNNEHAYFSNIYNDNDISAPGMGIRSCRKGGGYMDLDGTSMATPHVAGGAAIGVSVHQGVSVDGFEGCLKDYAFALGAREEYGFGLMKVDSIAQMVGDYRLSMGSRVVSALGNIGGNALRRAAGFKRK